MFFELSTKDIGNINTIRAESTHMSKRVYIIYIAYIIHLGKILFQLKPKALHINNYATLDYTHRSHGRVRRQHRAFKDWPRHPVKPNKYK
jgi:hypothetical protein